MNGLEISSYELSGILVFHLKGEIDVSNAKYMQTAIFNVMDVTTDDVKIRIIIDMSDVSFVDSSGINALIRVNKALVDNGGHLTVVKPSIQVRQVFKYMSLDSFIRVSESVNEAVKAA